VDWKERGHKKECKRLVKANAATTKEGAGDAAWDEASTPSSSPKGSFRRPLVPFERRAEVERAEAAAAAAIANSAPAVVGNGVFRRCPVCLVDYESEYGLSKFLYCCCKCICVQCDHDHLESIFDQSDSEGDCKLESPCPLCQMPLPERDEEKLAMLRRHVENDNPAAICELGITYVFGDLGLEKSKKKAARLFQRAADLGDVFAMYYLGCSYSDGQGLGCDHRRALKYYRKAADRGLAIAANDVGDAFYNGEGVVQDYSEAVRFFLQAVNCGNFTSAFELGSCYENGLGAVRDMAEAIRWYECAAANEMDNSNEFFLHKRESVRALARIFGGAEAHRAAALAAINRLTDYWTSDECTDVYADELKSEFARAYARGGTYFV